MSYIVQQEQTLMLSQIFKGSIHAMVIDALYTAIQEERTYESTGGALTLHNLTERTGLSLRSVKTAVADLTHANPMTGDALVEKDTTHKEHRYRLNNQGMSKLASTMRWP